MRVTNKGARAFFLWTLLAFIVMLCAIGWSMAEAGVNISPYTKKLRQSDVATNYAFIRNDTLFVDSMAVASVKVLKAVALQADTLRGSSSTVGIVDDTLIVDTDSTGSAVTIRFGRWGGGIRWNQATDAMQYTNDFSTWTAIGSGGSSSTNADSLGHKIARVRPLTDGYVLKYDSDGDSLYLSQDATGAAGDSNAIIYETDRVAPYTDSALYIGDIGDSTMLWYNLTDDNIISFVKVFYNEDVTDSALVTWGSMMAQVGATGSGDITGVITSPPLTGGASSGDVSLGLDWTWLYGFLDTSTVKIDSSQYSDTAKSVHKYTGDIEIRTNQQNYGITLITNQTQGAINLDAPTVTIDAAPNNIQLTGFNPWRIPYLGATALMNEVALGAAGTVFTSNGASSAPSFQTVATDTATLHLASKANIKDSIHTTRTMGSIWTLSADWVNTANPWADNEVANNLTVDDAGIASTITRDTEAQQLIRDSLYANSNAFLKAVNFKDSLGTGRVTSAIVSDQSLVKDDIDTTASNWVFDDAYCGTSAQAESLLITLNRARLLIRDSLYNNSNGFLKAVNFKDSLGTGRVTSAIVSDQSLTKSDIDTTASNWVFDDAYCGTSGQAESLLVTLNRTRLLIRDSLFANSNGFLKAVNFKDSLGTGRVTSTIIANQTIATADVDSSQTFVIANLRTRANLPGLIQSNNFAATDPDSSLKIGSAAGLTVTSSITLGTDITDDTLFVDYYPEPNNVVLANDLMPTYNDSIKIYGVIDSLIGNTLHFRDSTLVDNNKRRRGFQMTVNHPMRVDSLRYVIVEGLVKDSSATNEMYLKGMLRTTTFTMSCIDSNAAANIKDYDSLGGDWTDVQAIRKFVLTGGAVTPGTPWYLLITARHDAGTAWNWAEIGRIRFVYSRTRL